MQIEDKTNISSFENLKDVNKQAEVKRKQLESSKVKTNKTTNVNNSDKVDISQDAYKTNEMVNTLKEMPDIRYDKVDALKRDIDSGNYNVDGKMVADKIIRDISEGKY